MSPVFRSKLKQTEIKGFTSSRRTFVCFQGVAKTNENHDMFVEKRTKMGCTQRYVSKILRGKENLSLETLCKIERALGIQLAILHQTEKAQRTKII